MINLYLVDYKCLQNTHNLVPYSNKTFLKYIVNIKKKRFAIAKIKMPKKILLSPEPIKPNLNPSMI